MNTYWANFPKAGDPNGSGAPAWPRYDNQTEEIIDIDVNGNVAASPDPRKARFNVIEKAFKKREKVQARGI